MTGSNVPDTDERYEVVFWCRSELCFCDLRHAVEVGEHEFNKFMRYYDGQSHRVSAQFVNVYENDDLPDWDLDKFEVVDDDG